MKFIVHLHGELNAAHPEPIQIYARNAAEALEAVSLQLPGLQPCPVNGRRRVQVRDFDTLESLLEQRDGDLQELHVSPALVFSKEGGVLEVIVGSLLIVASFVVAPAAATLAKIFFTAGVSLVTGGILQMIAPQAKFNAGQANEANGYLGAPGNTVNIGTPIPILLGKYLVPGHVLSFDIDAARS
jgi:predicted phage tail protein